MTGSTLSHYEIVEELAAMTRSKLYKAREKVLGDQVVIRIFDPDVGTDEIATQRFIREAKSASALNHRHVSSILEIGRGPSGTALTDRRLFVVMPASDAAIAGELLAYGSKDPEKAVDAARQFLEGLSSAHELGLVHGRLMPDSIAVGSSGKAVVGDFGLRWLDTAEAADEEDEDVLAYRSPEQRQGRQPTPASDLYSAGAVLYTMIAGAPPTPGKDGRVPLLEGVSPELTDIVHHLLSPKPEDRPHSARATLDALQNVPEAAEADARSVFVVPMSRSWSRMLAAITVVAVGAAAIWLAVRPSGTATEVRTLAIAPFSVGDPAAAYLADGVSDALTVAFDSLDGWTTVGSDAVIGWTASHAVSGEADLAVEIDRRFNAGRVVVGEVNRDQERTIISADIYSGGKPIGRDLTVSFESTEDLGSALDELSMLIATELGIEERASVTARTSASSPALRSYLEGNRSVRNGRPDDAMAKFREALQDDPEFALAWSQLARAAQLHGDVAAADEALAEVTSKMADLSPRNRALTRARNLAFRMGRPDEARRLYSGVLEYDSTNVTALAEMGETMVRYNPVRGLDYGEAETFFKRALTYSPGQTPLVERLYGIAVDTDQPRAADSLLSILNSRGERGPLATFVRLATGLEDVDAADDLLKTADANGRMDRFVPGTTPFLRSLLAAAEGRFDDHSRLTWEAGADYAGARLVSEVMLRAHSGYPASDAKLEELATRIAQWDTAANPVKMFYDEDLFSGDYRAVKAFLSAAVALKSGNSSAVADATAILDQIATRDDDDLSRSLANTIRALEAERRADYRTALDLIERASIDVPWSKMSRSELYDQSLNRYIRSEILFSLGRYDESLRYSNSLTTSGDIWGLTYLGPLYLRRAETYANMGQIEMAVTQYRRLLELWDECDETLIGKREAARAELTRLSDLIED